MLSETYESLQKVFSLCGTSEVLLVTILSVLVLFAVYRRRTTYQRRPPGPWGLPLLGYYLFLGDSPAEKLRSLSEKFGSVVAVNLLGEEMWFLNDLDVIREAMVKKGENTLGRPTDRYTIFQNFFGSKALLTSDGQHWQVNSRLFNYAFSRLGMGKTMLENKLQMACGIMVDRLKALNCASSDVYEILAHYSANVMNVFLYNRFYDEDDPMFIKLREEGRNIFMSAPNIDSLLCGTRFKLFMYLFKHSNYTGLQRRKALWREIFSSLVQKRIQERPSGENSNYIDMYITNQEQAQGTTEEHLFDAEGLIANVSLLTVGGTEMPAITLYHAVNLMAIHTEVQTNVQKEIDAIIGSRTPSLVDIKSMHYSMAVMSEIVRFSCVIPFPAARRALNDFELAQYDVPKGKVIVVNVWSVSRDPEHFATPDEFNPHHFLTADGKFKKNEAHIPFSLGRRMCIGYKLAEAQMVMAFVILMQQFRWLPPPDGVVQREICEALVRYLFPFNVRALSRY